MKFSPLTVFGTTSGDFAAAEVWLPSPTLTMTSFMRGTDALRHHVLYPDAYSRHAASSNAARVGTALARVSTLQGDMRNLLPRWTFPSAMDGGTVRGLTQLAPDRPRQRGGGAGHAGHAADAFDLDVARHA